MINCGMTNPVFEVIVSSFLIFEALLFAIFVATMFSDQAKGIYQEQTGIDRLKGGSGHENNHNSAQNGTHGHKTTFFYRFKQVFGGGDFNWRWLLPFPPPLKKDHDWEF